MAKVPASIRNKNPGAMYPGPSADKFGSTGVEILRSGDGEHKIATFPTFEQGGAAMFDLLCRLYTGMTLSAAVSKWCGGIRASQYVAHIEARTELTAGGLLTHDLLSDSRYGIPLCKAMADWEAGRSYPMTDAQWAKAHAMAFDSAELEIDTSMPTYLTFAISKLGMTEVAGARDNNESILEFFEAVGRDDVTTDETAWCAAFVGACLTWHGYKLPPVPTKELLMARSYLKLPNEVKPANVRTGDLRIESRGPAPFGHVEFVVSVDHAKGTVKTIAGNVSNSVAYRTKTLKGGALLGYRRPSRDPAPVKFVVKSTPMTMLSGALMAVVAFVSGAMDWVTNGVLSVIGLIPPAVETAAPHIGIAQQVYGWFGRSPSAWLLTSILASALVATAWHVWKAERAK
jgi:uncharacterized protein (TIGR02594 family)